MITACFLLVQPGIGESPAGIPTALKLSLLALAHSGEMFSLEANVKALNQVVTSETVSFKVDQDVVGIAQINGAAGASGARATITAAVLPGLHLIRAQYSPSGLYQASESQLVTVTGAGSDDRPLTIQSDAADSTRVDFQFHRSPFGSAGSLVLRNAKTDQAIQSLHAGAPAQNGSFDQTSAITVGKQPDCVAYRDINGDGIPDLLVSNSADGTITVLMGDRDQIHFQQSSVIQIGGNPGPIVFGDFNNDGAVDVAVLDTLSGDVHLLMNDPLLPGHLQDSTAPIQTGQGTLDLVATDLNGDGIVDIATVNFINSEVSVFLGDPKSLGSFVLADEIAIPGGLDGLAVGNLYGGSSPDLVVAARNTGFVYALRNNQDNVGSFSIPDSAMYAGPGASAVLIADLNGDGSADIAVANSQSASITMFFGVKDRPGLFPTARDVAVGNNPTKIIFVPASTHLAPKILICNHDDGTIEIIDAGEKSSFDDHAVVQVGITADSLVVRPDADLSQFNFWIIADKSANLVRVISDAPVLRGSWNVSRSDLNTIAAVYATFEQLPGKPEVKSNTIALPHSNAVNGPPGTLIATGPGVSTTSTAGSPDSSSTGAATPVLGFPVQSDTPVDEGLIGSTGQRPPTTLTGGPKKGPSDLASVPPDSTGQRPPLALKGGPEKGPGDGGSASPLNPISLLPVIGSGISAAIPKFGIVPLFLPRFSLSGSAKKMSPQIELSEATTSTQDRKVLQLAVKASMTAGLVPNGAFDLLVDGVFRLSVNSAGSCCFTITVERRESGLHHYQLHFMGDNAFTEGYSNVYWTSALGEVVNQEASGGSQALMNYDGMLDVPRFGSVTSEAVVGTPKRESDIGLPGLKHELNDDLARRAALRVDTSTSSAVEGIAYFDPQSVLFRKTISRLQIAFPAPRLLIPRKSNRISVKKATKRTVKKRSSMRQQVAGACPNSSTPSHVPR